MYCAAAERLNAAVAEQAAELYRIAAVAQDVKQSLTVGTPKHQAWLEIVKVLATLNPDNAETVSITNLLAGLFAKGDIATPLDVAMVFDSWQSVSRLCSSPTLLHQHAA
jgi:hypothetical protein